ncbi:MAG: hypothetical protein D0531_03510 [Methylococcales bacterium]|nr:MAG: hypothetical protein D0531_03510 [Methylococcales bacterium]
MNINFTKEEYLLLLDIIYIADWILHAHSIEGKRSETEDYSALFQKLMMHAKEMGCSELIEFSELRQEHVHSGDFEDESAALDYLDEFEGQSFWDELISRLAMRDALMALKVSSAHEVPSEELFDALSKAEEYWSKEFESFDLSRISLNKGQSSILH